MTAVTAPPASATYAPAGVPAVAQTLTPAEEAEARSLYEEFRRLHPGVKNPSDINTKEKAFFLFLKGWERISLMQRARKQAYPFTRPDEH